MFAVCHCDMIDAIGAHRFYRAVDSVGNAQPASRLQWFVDTAPPAVPTIISGPENITTHTTATFSVRVRDDSPGQLRFRFTLRDGMGAEVVAAGESLTWSPRFS